MFRTFLARLNQATRRDQEGQGLVEYAFIVVLIALVVTVGVGLVGTNLNTLFTDIGEAEEPPARPTPTPPGPLTYTVLRPTWLPEPMTLHEERDGDTLILGFDPHPNDAPHDVLTLREIPRALVVPGGSPDPKQTHQSIAGRDVTIIQRGQDCITLTWVQGELELALTNPYDPPGHPRYTCNQLQKIVESIGPIPTTPASQP